MLAEPEVDEPHPLAVGLALVGLLRGLAADRPVIIGIDDCHWLDRASRRVLAFALRRFLRERIGLLATTRAAADTTLVDDIVEKGRQPGVQPEAFVTFEPGVRRAGEQRMGEREAVTIADEHSRFDRRAYPVGSLSLPEQLRDQRHRGTGGRSGGLHDGQPRAEIRQSLADHLLQTGWKR